MNNAAVSLYELNSLVRSVINETLPELFWVRAETSDVRVNQNGHCYLEFIEKDTAGKTLLARSRGMIWSKTFFMLKAYFESETKQPFTSGLKVLVQVSVDFHELYGFSLTVHDIDPSYTLGDQALNRAAIIRQLEEEGVLNLNKELELPLPLNRIAVISSPTAAGYEDFLDQLGNNPYKFVFYTKLFPAIMQGDRSEDSIISALERIYDNLEAFDAVVIIRGGGATSDLSSFDSYLLAASCAQFPLPVITGIGHDRDETVLDIVAHTSAKTPTAVAEFLISNMVESAVELDDMAHSIVSLVQQRLHSETALLDLLQTKNTFVLKAWRKEQESVLSTSGIFLKKGLQRITKENEMLLSNFVGRINKIALQNNKDCSNEILSVEDQLRKIIRQKYNESSNRLDTLEKRLHLSSPENILKKGYTLTMKDGKVVKSHIEINKEDIIETVFFDGKVKSVVKSKS